MGSEASFDAPTGPRVVCLSHQLTRLNLLEAADFCKQSRRRKSLKPCCGPLGKWLFHSTGFSQRSRPTARRRNRYQFGFAPASTEADFFSPVGRSSARRGARDVTNSVPASTAIRRSSVNPSHAKRRDKTRGRLSRPDGHQGAEVGWREIGGCGAVILVIRTHAVLQAPKTSTQILDW